ncbi:MAG TPA: sarcosine oxidase subunit gamma family protein [Terriglobia bacterium]|nr:sarcosine oxidase subunit gamma family protein [Terriglobia bacterium]
MFDRGRFWSPVPEWQQSRIERPDLWISAVRSAGPICLVSGNLGAFLTAQGLERCLGPRDICGAQRYALRLAPDRLLYVGDGASAGEAQPSFGWSDGIAVTDVSDGYLLFDILGRSAANIMRLGSAYDYDSLEKPAEESAMTLFAGIKVALKRLETGWRLHVERPAATALWHWLEKAR